MSYPDIPDFTDAERGNHVALISGGMDSAVAAHVAITRGPADIAVYLDTGTGLQSNREYCEAWSDSVGVQLWTLRTQESYEERVKESAFPGPSQHQLYYTALKERQIERLATFASGRGTKSDLHLWTGVRSAESQRRMEYVEPEKEGDRWTWHAPIHNWTKADCRAYLDAHDIPRNDLWDTLGRSGDCWCGCFGSPEEKLDLRAAGETQHAKWLDELECQVQADEKHERETWGWGGLDADEQARARAINDDAQMLLCSDCGLPSVTQDGEDSD